MSATEQSEQPTTTSASGALELSAAATEGPSPTRTQAEEQTTAKTSPTSPLVTDTSSSSSSRRPNPSTTGGASTMVEDADGAGSADDGRRGESGAHFSAVNQSGTIDNQNNNRSSSSRSNDDAEAAGGDGAGVGKDKEAGVSRPSKRPRDNAHQQQGVNQLALPQSMVRRIMKLGEDTRNVSKEALIVVSKASELFLERFATQAFNHAEKQGRRTIKYQDVSDVRVKDDNLLFLEAVVPP